MTAKDFGQLLKNHPEMLDDNKRFAAILRDVYPTERPNVNLMITAHSAGVVPMLHKSDLDSLLTARIISLLMDDYGVAEERARWAAELWIGAYSFYTTGTIPVKTVSPATNAPAVKPVTKPTQTVVQPAQSVQVQPSVTSFPLTRQTVPLKAFDVEKMTSGCYIKKYVGANNDTQVDIPAQIYGLPVIAIGQTAFQKCNWLTGINIPDSVTSIGRGAFHSCSSLSSITIPMSVTKIGEWAFEGCTSLTNIIIPDGVTSIGVETFSGCTSLTSITIPDSVTDIHRLAFRDCKKLKIYAPAGSYAEKYAKEFAKENNIPSGPLLIKYAPSVTNAPAMKSVTNPTQPVVQSAQPVQVQQPVLVSLQETSPSCFEIEEKGINCTIKKYIGPKIGQVVIPTYIKGKCVTEIGLHAFKGYTGLTSITVPNNITKIGASAFYDCTDLTSIIIPNSVRVISHTAFAGCTGLTSITIPNSIMEIGMEVFRDCTSLTNITIPNSVNRIQLGVFMRCTNLTSITIPNSVKSIPDCAFMGCTSLKNITIPDGVTIICPEVFKDCTGLKSITIPDSVTYIGARAFEGCTGLASINIPDGVKNIGTEAFKDCTSLTSITIPTSVASMSQRVFAGCNKLVIYAPVRSYAKEYAKKNNIPFQSEGKRTSVQSPTASLPSTHQTMPSKIFDVEKTASGYYIKKYVGTNNDTQVNIPAQINGLPVIAIGQTAFQKCNKLTSINIPDSVTSIGRGAFHSCSSLSSITIPMSVTKIGDWAFEGCTSLTDIIIPGGVTSIGVETFSGCTSLTSITIPDSVTDIHRLAFNGCKKLKIYAPAGSYAEKYAKENNILFQRERKHKKKWWWPW